ncbi:HDOD domain-containing protein [bacterium]|nr:HDOD domain-containing protein [bacterium]
MTQKLEPIKIDQDEFLKKYNALPALPEAITEIRKIVFSENVSIRKIVEIIEKDPGLVAQILKIVNSAYYSVPREVKDINLAVAYLGINEVYRIVISVYVLDALSTADKHAFHKIWYHSNYTALTAKFLGKEYEPLLNSNDLWVHSILHDIGKLIYLKFFPEHFKAVEIYCNKQGSLCREAEDFYNIPHSSYFGELLCTHWQLPEDIRETCSAHDLSDLPKIDISSETGRIRRIVTIGNLMSILATEKLRKNIKEDISKTIQKSLGCSESEFLLMMGKVYEIKIDLDKYL